MITSTLNTLIISIGFLIITGWRCKEAAWEIDWIGSPVQFQRSVCFIIAAANKEFRLTAGKFVPVCNSTMMNVRTLTIQRNNSGYRKRSDWIRKLYKSVLIVQRWIYSSRFPLQNRVQAHSYVGFKIYVGWREWNQLDATNLMFIIKTFISTYFGHHSAHHQENKSDARNMLR